MEPLKQWLAQVGRERIDEIMDPELSIDRAIQNYDHLPINKFLPLIISLIEKHKVKEAYIFGSAISDKFDEEKSDIDLLVNFIEGLEPLVKGELIWDLKFALEDSLNRPIDLITESSLKNPYFIEEINQTRIKIYG